MRGVLKVAVLKERCTFKNVSNTRVRNICHFVRQTFDFFSCGINNGSIYTVVPLHPRNTPLIDRLQVLNAPWFLETLCPHQKIASCEIGRLVGRGRGKGGSQLYHSVQSIPGNAYGGHLERTAIPYHVHTTVDQQNRTAKFRQKEGELIENFKPVYTDFKSDYMS